MGQLGWKDLIGPGGVLLSSIITQLVTIALLFANNNMAYKRSRREKLWDLKRELYSKVISKVIDIQAAYAMARGLYDLPGADDALKKTAMENEYNVFQTIIQAQDIFDDNYLMFSRAFLRAYAPIKDLNMLEPTLSNAEPYSNVLAERKRFMDKLHVSLVAQARKELETGD